ncbi:MAG: hypothetical protein V4858_28795 [Pseudomonadota bacterium]
METAGASRHPSIEGLSSQHFENTADVVIALWDQLATQIIAIVGIGGFDALFARSIFLTQSKFPWLAGRSTSPAVGHRFADLKASLEGTTPEQAYAANHMLMITFTDVLASLIGERLTTRILDTAWGHGGGGP